MKTKPTDTDVEKAVLEQLAERPRFLHIGLSPVSWIQAAWKLTDEGKVRSRPDGYIEITDQGRSALAQQEEA